MQALERTAEVVGNAVSAMFRAVDRSVTSLFGSANARFLRRLQPQLAAINLLAPKLEQLSNDELRQHTVLFRERLAKGETLEDLLVEAFAVCREAGRRFLGLRHYDVQMLGGMVLHSGAIAEMVTGEGKTLVATLPAYLNALSGQGVHVITVNDYLARRDMEWMGPLYMGLGLTVGAIQSKMESSERQKAYACDITYGTNNEFGFDYLRDNMKLAARGDNRYPSNMQQVQGPLHFAIIDEVDNILVDEARTPLIISGPAHDDVTRYARADKIARQLVKDRDFEVKEKEHNVILTEDGVREAERLAGVESFYTAGNMDWPHLIDNSLKAHHLYKRDVNYVVQQGEVIIVDEFTGRLMPGRNWSDGLHQAVEAKEAVNIKKISQTYATITLQNFFKLYGKICGMTGTAMTEATEFWKIYKLEVVAIPTNRSMQRLNHRDVVYRSEQEKFEAIIDEIERYHRYHQVQLSDGTFVVGKLLKEHDDRLEFELRDSRERKEVRRDQIEAWQKPGRPILVGTVSIEKSERLGAMLGRLGIEHEVLNAKHHQREAEIVAQAGRFNAVTIATNMAGRGTDIILGGNPETMAWALLQDKYPTRLEVPQDEWTALVAEIEQREQMKAEGAKVKELGGLHIIGSERHEARRIDLQLRGRCGRQGDPGSSRFFLSLEDDLMRIFGGEWVKNFLTRWGMMREGEAIESRLVSKRIEGAQKKVEERNFEIRKNLLEYDELMDEQRKRVYSFRQRLLDGANCKDVVLEQVQTQVAQAVSELLAKDYGAATYARWASDLLGVELEARSLQGLDVAQAETQVRESAGRQAESQLFEAIEENLPRDAEDENDWNWEALAQLLTNRWKIHASPRELKQLGRDQLYDSYYERVREAVEGADLGEGAKFLTEDFGLRSLTAWAQHKFGVTLDPQELKGLDADAARALVLERANAAYDQREALYPVVAALSVHSARDEQGRRRLDPARLAAWAKERFDAEISEEQLRGRERQEIVALLLEYSRRQQTRAAAALAEVDRQVARVFPSSAAPGSTVAQASGGNGALTSLVAWLSDQTSASVATKDLESLDAEGLRNRLTAAVFDRFHPEMRKMERGLLLHTLDAAWKEHLLAMDHLLHSVRLRAYGQSDPKVEYKREGMKLFDQMWVSIGNQVTDLVFRMEQLDDGFVRSTWSQGTAKHEEVSRGALPPAAGGPSAQDQQTAVEGTETGGKKEPIRNLGQRVGRNDPCPCGSGKKFKACCMRKTE